MHNFDELNINLELGKKSAYEAHYNPEKLLAIPRHSQRQQLGIKNDLPFFGFDVWNHYEVSWLNSKGKPVAAVAEIIYACDSPCLIESKSMKLYFNSFNNTQFDSLKTVENTVIKDIENKIGAKVFVKIIPLHEFARNNANFTGICLDELDIDCNIYSVDPTLLSTEESVADETLYSHLLKSNCLVTHQPDWASIQIQYRGKKINHENLLRYLISFRNHSEFGEHCIERIFTDIMHYCAPQSLSVYGRYTRRGGLDVNPYRSTEKDCRIENEIHVRQ